MKFSLLLGSIFVQAVLHKEFVGAKSDKLLARRRKLVVRRAGGLVRRLTIIAAAWGTPLMWIKQPGCGHLLAMGQVVDLAQPLARRTR